MHRELFLGIDIGSVSIKTALIDANGVLLAETCARIKGDPLKSLDQELASLSPQFSLDAVRTAGITGSGGKQAAELINARFVNEILAQARFAGQFHPKAASIIEMGGEDAKLIMLGHDAAGGAMTIEDFSMNTVCAAGTGSFLDQQASRLRLSIEDFGRLALQSTNPPRVAGRCSVFAKSDMIHLQQIATPDFDIVAGLCAAMARNFKATVGRGKKINTPALFLGGVAANFGMRRALQEVLRLDSSELIVPEHFATSGAIGAAFIAREQRDESFRYQGTARLAARSASGPQAPNNGAGPLRLPAQCGPFQEQCGSFGADGPVEAYLGVDVGSVSTNVVVIDAEGRVLAKRYLPTAGRPIEAVKQGLAEVGAELGRRVTIQGAGTTGSGRYLTGDMIGADVIKNEITAQATAAAAIDPTVDTIFEIGGQDSKYISLRNKAVVDFEMNKACAAGTGSFLEEQAERLGISIRKEFEDRAFQARTPCSLGERCTVFMESDLVHSMNTGSSVNELTAGLACSIAYNYLNKVVAGKKVGSRIFFQGGVASNKAVVSAFERITGKTVTVPPHHEVTGAIGAALLARQARGKGPSTFKGFDLSSRSYAVTTFECAECANRCSIQRVNFDHEAPLFYGSRCEKYDVKRTRAAVVDHQDLFVERERLLTKGEATALPGAPTLGIPRMLFLHDYLPYWQAFFTSLGYRVVLSDRTNRTLINKGLEAAVAETCFPARVALGHIQDLLDKNVDLLFLPSFIRLPAAREGELFGTQACPYTQSLPSVARAALSLKNVRILEPALHLHDQRHRDRSLKALGAALGKSSSRIKKAQQQADAAQQVFVHALSERSREVLSTLAPGEKLFVLIGRSYNTCDAGLNMNLPAKIRELGIRAIPMDLLPLNDVDLTGWESMYWRSGQRILAAARFIKNHPNLYPIYLTNFGCGPDSFITHFFREELGSKPFLQLEIDEHSADAGAITRIEAFLDSLGHAAASAPQPVAHRKRAGLENRTVYVPAMADHAHALAAAFRACNVDAVVLPESDSETRRLGREHSSGRECYPLMLTVGDMIKASQKKGFDPGRSAFFMPGGKGPCRFGQYQRYHRQVLDSIGLAAVPIFAPMQDETLHRDVRVLDRNFVRMCWQGTLAVDLLEKMLRESRPYELQQGQADRVYASSLDSLVRAIENRSALSSILEQAYAAFTQIAVAPRGRPVIGVVGEIYIRSNRFSNEGLVRQIESLGGEVRVAPVSEWLFYLTETSKVSARMNRAWKALLTAHLTAWVQQRDESRFLGRFNGSFRSLHEPTIAQTLQLARPYLHDSFEGEAVLSVGKTIDFINKGVSGMVNVMPLSCMPGTITTAVLKRVREAHPSLPMLNIAYEGQQDTQTLTRLEAFMHQARSRGRRS